MDKARRSSGMIWHKEQGMQTLDQALRDLFRNHIISLDEALKHTNDPENLRRLMEV